MLANEYEAAIARGGHARDLADTLGDLETSLHAQVNIHTARLQRGEAEAAGDLAATHEQAASAGYVDHAARSLVNLSTGLIHRGDFAGAAPATERTLAYVTAEDLDGYVQYMLGVRADIRLAACAWDLALADAEDALARPMRTGVSVLPALSARAHILAARGDPRAEQVLKEVSDLAGPTGEIQRVGPACCARSDFLLWNGDPAGAAEEARRGLDLAMAARQPHFTGKLAIRVWREGGAPADILAAMAEPYRMMLTGDWAGAALRWERSGDLFGRAEALAAGDEAAAGEALAVLDRLGAARAGQWLRAELRRRGFTRVPRGPSRPRPRTAPG